MRKIINILCIIGLPAIGYSHSITALERIQISIEEHSEGFFKTASGIDYYKNWLFVVDNAYHRVLAFDLQDNKLTYSKSYGKQGQGPGDLDLPMRISIWNDILAVQDQFGISFFHLDGSFLSKFRLFSGCLTFLFTDKKIFHAAGNPARSDLIEVYAMSGERIQTFGEKRDILDFSYHVVQGMSPLTTEMVVFDMVMLSDEAHIYLLNRRFGVFATFTMSGAKTFQKDIISLLGENEERKAKENIKLFLVNGYDSFVKDRFIPQNYLFRNARLMNDKIFLLIDQWDFLRKKKNSFLDIKVIDKTGFNLLSTYRGWVSEDERILSFSVHEDDDHNPLFLVLVDSDEGYKFFWYKPV